MTSMKPVEEWGLINDKGDLVGTSNSEAELERRRDSILMRPLHSPCRVAAVRITEIPKRWTKRQHEILRSIEDGWLLMADGPSTFLFGPRDSLVGYEVVFRNTVQPLIDAGEVKVSKWRR